MEFLVDHTHTHTPVSGPFSGTTQVSRYQKGKTNLDFTEARDSEWQWHQIGLSSRVVSASDCGVRGSRFESRR